MPEASSDIRHYSLSKREVGHWCLKGMDHQCLQNETGDMTPMMMLEVCPSVIRVETECHCRLE